ncbi:MAG TPA: hypothetical protein VGD56_21140 [Gemmatirosa sp.]
MLLPGSLVDLWRARGWTAAGRRTALAALAATLGGVTLFSAARMRRASTETAGVRVALVATNQFAGIARSWAPVWAAYAPTITRSAPHGGMVVLPEKLVLIDAAGAIRAAHDAAAAARERGDDRRRA